MSLLPEFVDYLSQYAEFDGLAQALAETEPEVSVRLNPSKSCDQVLFEGAEEVPWCAEGRYLNQRPAFTFDPAMHQGRYYVQDASSMALWTVLKELAGQTKVRYLDACAAPGGKTTCALAALPQGSIVVANEFDYKRAEILAENVAKWGNQHVVVSRGDTSRLSKLKAQFDIVSVDAPCSGEGMMRKDAQAASQWSMSLVDKCASLQREILCNAWQALRPGGYLIYSTCTFNTKEDEDNLQWLVSEFDALPVRIEALEKCNQIVRGIGTSLPCYRFLPSRIRGEGLFMAVVQKPGLSAPVQIKSIVKDDPKLSYLSKWLKGDNLIVNRNGEIYALPSDAAAFMVKVASTLDVLSVGTHIATLKGKDVVPTQALAMSQMLSSNAFERVDVALDDAIKYLQREAIVLPDNSPRDYVLLTYQDCPLGFVKNLGNRSNNLYPKNWRILSRKNL